MFPRIVWRRGGRFDVAGRSPHDASMYATAVVALGSNVGDRLGHLRAAAAALRRLQGVHGFRASRLYETPAVRLDGVGELGGDDAFLNGAVAFETEATPHGLLAELLDIESRLGRLPRERRAVWGPRPIDLDLLLLGDRRVNDATLTLPHPRIGQRWFVLAPMVDLVPEALVDRPEADDNARQASTVRAFLGRLENDPAHASSLGRVYADASWVDDAS